MKNNLIKIILVIVAIVVLIATITLLIFGSKKDSEEIIIYKDSSGANAPVITDGLIPVMIDENGVAVYADVDEEWYNYGEQTWANAIVLNTKSTDYSVGETINSSDIAAYYVWIPRYAYKLFNVDGSVIYEQTIEINFESSSDEKSSGTANEEWLTHPAFTFDGEELDGIWVAKFEVTGTTDLLTVLPNISSLRSTTQSDFYYSMLNFSEDYELTADSHMIKNTEWGAVTYLTYSEYGINTEVRLNNNSSYITGCGASIDEEMPSDECLIAYGSGVSEYPQSTTGNISGIFDMSGGAFDLVMGNYDETVSYSEFAVISEIEDKYIDQYTTEFILGDATYENNLWYSNYSIFITSDYPWFARGGSFGSSSAAGISSFNVSTGGTVIYESSRIVLVQE